MSYYCLGVMYENGFGARQNYSKANLYYQRASESGHIKSIVNLGFMYLEGRGVHKDIKVEIIILLYCFN
jgi:TPR repeat protein